MYSISWKKSRNTWMTERVPFWKIFSMVGKTSNRDSQSINTGGCKGASKKCQGTRYFAFTEGLSDPILFCKKRV